MGQYSIAICAGEASGDLNGSYLVEALKERRNDITFWGAGGKRLKDAGVNIIVNTDNGGTIGIFQTLKSLPAEILKYHRMRWELLRRKPDLFIPIDFGAFNIRLAQIAYRNGIDVVYYFPPSSWRKKAKNASALRACGGKVITPFSWSAESLASQGLNAYFPGHPLVDIVKPSLTRKEFFESFKLDETLPLIGLLPGSRNHEISAHLHIMAESALRISKELNGAQFVVGAAKGRSKKIKSALSSLSEVKSGNLNIVVAEGATYDCMAHSDLLITSSGTATLEAAILETPMIIVYGGSPLMRFEFRLRRAIIESYIGLPNIIADKEICPELILDLTVDKLTEDVLSLLRNKSKLEEMKTSLAEVRAQLGDVGAINRAADMLLNMGDLK